LTSNSEVVEWVPCVAAVIMVPVAHSVG